VAERTFDVAVIGAGVVGAAIARELSRYRLDVALIDAASDVGTGTTKANTAIWHTGFDARPGTLEAQLVRRGHDLLSDYAAAAGIPVERTGALLIAWNDAELAALDGIVRVARANGYLAARLVRVSELYRREPQLAPGACGGIEVPDEGILCPFTLPLACATEAVLNGTALLLNTQVTGRSAGPGGGHLLRCGTAGRIRARFAVNAAGLHADTVDRLFGHDGFAVSPRRGELIVFDKLARPLISHILLPVPTPVSKGVLIAPTVFGNIVLGPTADEVEDRTATESTAAGIAALRGRGRQIVPALLAEEVTAVYAGLRAATGHADYQITCFPDDRYLRVAGIRSTGLSASLAIAEHVTALLADAGLALRRRDRFSAVRMPGIGEASARPYRDASAIRGNPDYGRIICHCERVTAGEITDACRAVIPARTLDGVRRRTRATMGRCQGFFCGARVVALVSKTTGQPPGELLSLPDSGTLVPEAAAGPPPDGWRAQVPAAAAGDGSTARTVQGHPRS
jgi:glycerol-3-phosphate dehydrogenase